MDAFCAAMDVELLGCWHPGEIGFSDAVMLHVPAECSETRFCFGFRMTRRHPSF